MEPVDSILSHHGIKGMKWGIRTRSSGSSGGHASSSDDAAKAKAYASKAKSSGLHTLSNQELQHLVTRQGLESQYKRLQGNSRTDAGAKVAKEILLNAGKQHLTKLAVEGLANATKAALKKK